MARDTGRSDRESSSEEDQEHVWQGADRMKRTREIERAGWSVFLNGFSRQHEGWLVTVEQVSMPSGPAAVEARELPLESVSADPDGTISVSVGGTPERHLTHIVPRAARLLVEETDEGVDRGLRIDRNYGP